MKRTWIVYVEGGGIGHELHDSISEAEFYGPYMQEMAERIAVEFNAVMDHSPDKEAQMATALSLQFVSKRDMRRKAVTILDNALETSTEGNP